MANPLSAVDDFLTAALREHVALIALVPAERIQVWDDAVVGNFELEDAAAMGTRIWIAPIGTDPDFEGGNVTVDFVQRYRVGYATGDESLEKSRLIEWAILDALAKLYMGKDADGAAQQDAINTAIAPLVWDTAVISKCDIEREVAGAEMAEWRSMCDVEIRTHCHVESIVVT